MTAMRSRATRSEKPGYKIREAGLQDQRSWATRSEKPGYKIREAGIDKVPYIIVVGEKEQAEGSVSVRRRDAEADKQDLGAMKPEDFLKLIDEEMK